MNKFQNKQKFTKQNIQKAPESKAVVYKISDNKGKNLYTGSAGRGRVQARLAEHKDVQSEKIPDASKFQIQQVQNKEVARKVEKSIIKKEQPKFNEQDK